jgi:hypothetical protein
MSFVLYRTGCYRRIVASVAQRIAGWFVEKLWDWIYHLGLSQQEAVEWIQRLFPTEQKRTAAGLPDVSSEEWQTYLEATRRLLSRTKISMGDFQREVIRAVMDGNPGPGYRWDMDSFGRKFLVKTRSEVEERGVVRGKDFRNKILIGIWWTTKNPRGSPHRSLVGWIKKNNGGVFLNWAYPEGGREYGGFVITPSASAPGTAENIYHRIEKAVQDGDGEYRLSAVSLDALADGDRIENSDKVRLPHINSIKFGWQFTLPDLLNGRVAEYKREPEYQKLVQMLRSARDAAKGL